MRQVRVRLVVGLLAGLPASVALAQKGGQPPDAVALIGDTPISAAEFQDSVGNRLIALETQAFQAKQRLLEELINHRLLEKEAASRGLTVEALEKAEIDSKADPVTDEELTKVREGNRERLVGMQEDKATQAIRDAILERHMAERRKTFLLELRARSRVRILLDPPRVAMKEADAPTIGPKTAPVTVVEFSDFQCPYCAQAAPIVKQIRETYGDKVRVVFREFPLSIHRDAPKAAEAGACAQEQGKFWEMHDKLFADQKHLEVADLKESAKALGLDTEAFDSCLDSGRNEATWKADTKDGEGYGVSGTPFFFVNGRILSGVIPFDAFKSVIDQELERVAPPQAAPKASGR
jgi:predicted DsbA family dithiol-disulfide isomerase